MTKRIIATCAVATIGLVACGGSSHVITDPDDRSCRRIEGEPDGFGGEVRMVRVWDDLAGSNGSGVVQLSDDGSETRLGLGVGLVQIGGFLLPAGSTFEVRFSDDDILTFQSDADFEGALTMMGWSGVTLAVAQFSPSDAELAKLTAERVVGLRVTTPNGTTYAAPIGESDAEEIQTAATCFSF